MPKYHVEYNRQRIDDDGNGHVPVFWRCGIVEADGIKQAAQKGYNLHSAIEPEKPDTKWPFDEEQCEVDEYVEEQEGEDEYELALHTGCEFLNSFRIREATEGDIRRVDFINDLAKAVDKEGRTWTEREFELCNAYGNRYFKFAARTLAQLEVKRAIDAGDTELLIDLATCDNNPPRTEQAMGLRVYEYFKMKDRPQDKEKIISFLIAEIKRYKPIHVAEQAQKGR